jgi:hypothetical protein
MNFSADFTGAPEHTDAWKKEAGLPPAWKELQDVQYGWVVLRQFNEDLEKYENLRKNT